MTTITFIEHSGSSHEVTAEEGQSLMEAATDAGVPGIDADCGGACACGTCHVKIPSVWKAKLSQLTEVSDVESGMLSLTPEYEEGSRLSCQVRVTPEMDGMSVQLPEYQM